MYKLIGNPKNRAFRVLWMLEELGEPYELVAAGPRSPELLAVNPSGKSPCLEVDGEVIIDSTAIIQFLADRHGKFTHPAGTLERARQDSFTQFALDDLDGVLWSFAKHKMILPEELRVDGLRPAAEYDLNRAYTWLEKRMDGGDYVMGGDFTVPDIIIGHCAGWAIGAKFGWPEGALGDYFTRLRDRPAWKRASEIRQNS